MKEDNFDKMLADLIREEEIKLGINSEEFQKKHKEIMELLEKMKKQR